MCAVARPLPSREVRAARQTGIRTLCIAGGVAANRSLSLALQNMAQAEGLRLVIPAPNLCTDNAALIAGAG